jgi:hypothetical protein
MLIIIMMLILMIIILIMLIKIIIKTKYTLIMNNLWIKFKKARKKKYKLDAS